MVKAPVPGRVKTRLAAEIGTVGAANWYRRQTTRLLRNLGSDPRWRTILAVAPDHEVNAHFWRYHGVRLSQGQGDLGTRMTRLLRQAGPGKAVLIGSDIPGATPAAIASAFGKLGPAKSVFGPARDGGFWLVGVRNAAAAFPEFPVSTRWSTEHTLKDAQAPFYALGSSALCDTLDDIDIADDMRQSSAHRPGWI